MRYQAYLDWYKTTLEKPRSVRYMTLVTLLAVAGAASLTLCHEKKSEPIKRAHYSIEELHYINVFKKHKSPYPEEMACAVTKTKNPPLMAALAIKESNADPHIKGDSGDSEGAFQIQRKHWGPVPKSATGQALKAERILEDLLAASPRRGLRYALARYNGGNTPPDVSFRRAGAIIKLSKKLARC